MPGSVYDTEKGPRFDDSGSNQCVPMLGYVSFSSLNVSWLLRKFCPSPSDRTSFTGGQTSNVSSDRLLNEHSLSGIFGIFLKRSHTHHWDGGEEGWYFRWRKLEEIVCGNFPIFDRATPRRTGKCFFKGNIYREYIIECRGVSEYWLSLKRFIVSINRKGFPFCYPLEMIWIEMSEECNECALQHFVVY